MIISVLNKVGYRYGIIKEIIKIIKRKIVK